MRNFLEAVEENGGASVLLACFIAVMSMIILGFSGSFAERNLLVKCLERATPAECVQVSQRFRSN